MSRKPMGNYWSSPIMCLDCQSDFPKTGFPHRCPECGGVYDFAEPLRYAPESSGSESRIWRYRETFPLPPGAKSVTLGEGNTPLVSYQVRGRLVYFKCEHLNPTGSFKDRGTAILASALEAQAIERAVEDSSGNAGASFAAYAARAGIHARIFIPSYASGPKRLQMEAYGAEIERIPGPRSAASEAVLEALKAGETYASHAYLPHGIAGMATTAFEIFEDLGDSPGSVILPVGQGTLLLGLARGFQALRAAKKIQSVPQLIAVQAKACAPLWREMRKGESDLVSFEEGETLAEGIRIKSPIRMRALLDAIRASQGDVVAVDESELMGGWNALAKLGLYVEHTSAVVWPALLQNLDRIREPVVIILTGSGFKSI